MPPDASEMMRLGLQLEDLRQLAFDWRNINHLGGEDVMSDNTWVSFPFISYQIRWIYFCMEKKLVGKAGDMIDNKTAHQSSVYFICMLEMYVYIVDMDIYNI